MNSHFTSDCQFHFVPLYGDELRFSHFIRLMDDPESGMWYLFNNRTRTLMKCVRLDRSGVWMGARRFKQGHYRWVERSRGISILYSYAAEDLCSGKQPKVYD